MVRNTEVKELGHFINGKVVVGKSGRFSDVYNPSSGIVIAKVPLATKGVVKEAMYAAQKAFPAWLTLYTGKRAEIILKFQQLLTDRMDALMNMICKESGKTLICSTPVADIIYTTRLQL
ncbi:aldehyde dehydrogenase family protein [Lysinibacillus pakistanensis]|uniref:Aldehyde dehydrogenase family protein n=1 Tax=Lysinibacillus pakistanensis TaxID=759811 RepID=A0AAX3X2V8_9BACI|nr:aldehyde dehydrogenase family protein [Lysinibacillus pakistanensis]MDM5232685.1 aldehyde dehydrogenase family protein [Lysinibacillus pakistanensis]WHY48188.1 aldehyde dehydrogenase family protein [Lysinibacillus pakistanensis]WHY53201.1 aldehyde dehydrogenase family protein [Lysinibacillus pakistanensis]